MKVETYEDVLAQIKSLEIQLSSLRLVRREFEEMSEPKPDIKLIFSTPEAAKFVGTSASSLRRWRSKNVGPLCWKTDNGRIFYERGDLSNWITYGRAQDVANQMFRINAPS